MNKQNTVHKTIMYGVIAILALAGCTQKVATIETNQVVATQTPVATVSATQMPAPSQTALAALSKTYTNTRFKFSFNYPSTWALNPCSASGIANKQELQADFEGVEAVGNCDNGAKRYNFLQVQVTENMTTPGDKMPPGAPEDWKTTEKTVTIGANKFLYRLYEKTRSSVQGPNFIYNYFYIDTTHNRLVNFYGFSETPSTQIESVLKTLKFK